MEIMHIKQETTIEGKIADLIKSLNGGKVEIYRLRDDTDEYVELFFVSVNNKQREVMFKQIIECEMGQSIGYVSNLTFEE
jgi:hypothetical protein